MILFEKFLKNCYIVKKFKLFLVDQIYHLASPASPPHYMYNPVKTLKTNILGTLNMLGMARFFYLKNINLNIFLFLKKS